MGVGLRHPPFFHRRTFGLGMRDPGGRAGGTLLGHSLPAAGLGLEVFCAIMFDGGMVGAAIARLSGGVTISIVVPAACAKVRCAESSLRRRIPSGETFGTAT